MHLSTYSIYFYEAYVLLNYKFQFPYKIDVKFVFNFEWKKLLNSVTPAPQVWKLRNHQKAHLLIKGFSMVSKSHSQFP